MRSESASNVVDDEPTNCRQILINMKANSKKLPTSISLFFWVIYGVYSALKSDSSLKGTRFSIPVYDLLLITIASVLMHYALRLKQMQLAVPWLIVSIGSLYSNHYVGLMNELTYLKVSENIPWVRWVSLAGSMLVIVFRMTLTLRILQLWVRIWLSEKFKKPEH